MRIKLILGIISFSLFLSSCNVFDPFEPNSNHFDRCKLEADQQNYDSAEEECLQALEEADGNTSLQNEINLELGDIYLAKAGVSLDSFAALFLDNSTDTNLFVKFAENIISHKRNITDDEGVTKNDLENAEKAINSFAKMGDPFFSLLGEVCYMALVMGYTDYQGNKDGKISAGEVCSSDGANCSSSVNGIDLGLCLSSVDANGCSNGVDEYFVKVGGYLDDIQKMLVEQGWVGDDTFATTDALLNTQVDVPVYSPTGTENYIITEIQDANDADTSIDSIKYYDGTTIQTQTNVSLLPTSPIDTAKKPVDDILSAMGTSKDEMFGAVAQKLIYTLITQ